MHTSVTMYYNEFLIYFAILKLEIKFSRTTALEFQDFPGFSRTYAFSRTFQAWKSQQLNSMTFQGLYEPCNKHMDGCVCFTRTVLSLKYGQRYYSLSA